MLGVGAYLAGSNGTSSSFASVTAYGGGRGAIFWRGTTYLSAYDAGTGSGVVGSGGGEVMELTHLQHGNLPV